MITKPEKIKKRILKAIGKGQSVLIIGEWEEEFTDQIKENNSISISSSTEDLKDNIFTRLIIDYSLIDGRVVACNDPTVHDMASFYKEARRLLLPTGMLIVTANSEPGFFEKIIGTLARRNVGSNKNHKPPATSHKILIKPKILQDQIHDNGFLIDGYYGYPGGDILMMAIIQNKEVSTLFGANKQETIAK